jgi:pilus assembly protein FimV
MLARCKKTIALLALVTGTFYTGNIFAVELGELTVNSSLNEPLDADIQLLGLDGLTENQINVSLGNLADFQRANIARVGLIDDISPEIDVLNRETGIIHLTTDQVVTEPSLTMVFIISWPNGRLVGDYTALIDLPVFFSDESKTVPLDVPETPSPPPQSEPRGSQFLADDGDDEAPEAPTPVATAPVTEPAPHLPIEGEVSVEAGDTLYKIAAANRPSGNVSIEQTMLAIQRSNPDAFIDNNINRIRAGRVLRIPSLLQIQSVNQSQAVSQIALQNQALTTQPLAFSNNNAAGGQQGNDELTILSGNEGTASLSGDDDMAATIAALENQLMISEENLDRARLENQVLRARFAELEEQIDILQNIIAMQDARLAQLQANLATAQASEPEPEPAPAETPTPAQQVQAPQDNSIMGQLNALLENTLVLVGSFVAVIVLVIGLLVWRRDTVENDLDEFAVAGGPGSVSSFENKEAPAITEEPEEEVETIDFDRGGNDSSDEVDSSAAALGEVAAEEKEIEDNDMDLSDIEIDDNLFDADEDDAGYISQDESATKLDLAVAYEAMGDLDGAREILNEVIAEGSEHQVTRAKELLEKWG